ncbi:MAG: hypothetical protein PVF68_12990 [Acidobacteriota bacterium]
MLLYAHLDERQQPLGYGRLGPGGGSAVDPEGLAIVRYEGETSVYLLYCDASWNVLAETWHPREEAARAQAEREFRGLGPTWEKGAGAPEDPPG